MKKYLEFFKKVPLFQNIDINEIGSLLKCLDVKLKTYGKNEFIILAGEKISSIGLIIKGSVYIISEDGFGERNILAKLTSGNIFAEAFVCAGLQKSPVSVVTIEECEIMALEFKKIIHICPNSCSYHSLLIENMLKIIANKNILLNNKMEILNKRSIREKLITYFSQTSKEQNNSKFKIPFSREELADYLCVNRSALSRELSNMKNEGLINFNKNDFKILVFNESFLSE